MRSPTARDAAEGLAEQIERRMKAASLLGGAQLREAMMDLGRLVYVESTPIITALRSAGTEGGETQGAIPEECLCPSGETFTADEVCDHLRAAVDEAGGVDAWAAAARVSRHGAADFLAGGPLTSHRLMNAIGFEPVTVYRPITEAGRRALRTRTIDGGEA